MFVVLFLMLLLYLGKSLIYMSQVYTRTYLLLLKQKSHIFIFPAPLDGATTILLCLGLKGSWVVRLSCMFPVFGQLYATTSDLDYAVSDVKKSLEDTFQPQQGYPGPCVVVAGIWFNYSGVQTNLILYLTLLWIESFSSLIFLPKPSFSVNFVQGTFRCLLATTLADTFLTQFRRG